MDTAPHIGKAWPSCPLGLSALALSFFPPSSSFVKSIHTFASQMGKQTLVGDGLSDLAPWTQGLGCPGVRVPVAVGEALEHLSGDIADKWPADPHVGWGRASYHLKPSQSAEPCANKLLAEH